MKQTQNAQAYSLAREWAAAYSLAIGVAVEVTGESGEAGAFSLAREGRQWLPMAVSRAAPGEKKLQNRCQALSRSNSLQPA